MTRFALMKMMGQTRLPFPIPPAGLERNQRLHEIEDEGIEETDQKFLVEADGEDRGRKSENSSKGNTAIASSNII